jgi:hypothetical protein
MALESATYINGLVTSNPASTDGLAAADDHLRLLKSTVKASFPGVTGAVNSTHTELNVLDGIATGLTATELNVLDGIPSTLTATELGYVDGVTSALQTQMDAKTPASRTVSAGSGMTGGGALTGDITLTHADTSTQVSVDNSGTTFVQDVTLDTYGHVTGLTSATVPADTSIGVNQSWQDVKANRTTNTYYENDTGRVIMVSAAMLDSAGYVADDSSGTNEIMIAFDDGNSNTYSQLHMLIPAGKYYKCGSGSIHKWTELR